MSRAEQQKEPLGYLLDDLREMWIHVKDKGEPESYLLLGI